MVAREGRRDRRRGWWVARGSKGGWNAPRRAAAKPDGDGLSFCSASAASSLSILSVLLQPFLYLVFFLRIPFLLLRLVVHPPPSFPLSFLPLSLSLSLFHPVNFHFVLSLLHSDPPLPRLTCLLFPRARPYALSFIPCDPPLFLSRCFCLSPFHPPTQTTAVQSSVGPWTVQFASWLVPTTAAWRSNCPFGW